MKMMSMVPGAVPLTPQNALVHASPGARSCSGNCQTACDDRFKAGPLRGDPASPRVQQKKVRGNYLTDTSRSSGRCKVPCGSV